MKAGVGSNGARSSSTGKRPGHRRTASAPVVVIKSDREGPADLRRQIEDEEVQLSKACLAAKAGDVEALRSMDKDELASTSEGDPAASQAVRYAAAFDRVECVRELHVGMDIDMTVPCDAPGNTPAFWAASCDRPGGALHRLRRRHGRQVHQGGPHAGPVRGAA